MRALPKAFAAMGAGLVLPVALLAGCVPAETRLASAAAPAGLGDILRPLAAAALDEAPEEVFRILRPPAPPEPAVEEPPREPERPPRTGRLKFGLRCGMVTSLGTDVEWNEAPQYGLYLRRVPFERRRMTYELAADYTETERPDEFRTSTLYTLHGDLVFGGVGGRGTSFYLLIGAAAVLEDSLNNVSGESSTGQGAGAEAGVGMGAASGLWEIRAVFTQIVATANANSLVSVSFGLAF